MSACPPPRQLLLLALVPLLSGCLSLGGREEGAPIHTYDLCVGPAEPPPVELVADDAPSLQVEPFTADPLLQGEGLVWRRGQVEVGAYRSFRWARAPQDALRDALAGALGQETAAVRVATEPPLPDPTWRLRGHLARCEELDRGDRWVGVLELHLSLTGAQDMQELWRRTYRVEEPAHPRNPPGVALALHRACERITAAAAADVRALLAAQEESKGP